MKAVLSVKGTDQLSMSTGMARVFALAEKKQPAKIRLPEPICWLPSVKMAIAMWFPSAASTALPVRPSVVSSTAMKAARTVTKTARPWKKYGQDLTAKARKGALDPVIGRDDEIRRTVEILSRRKKNNPCPHWGTGVLARRLL